MKKITPRIITIIAFSVALNYLGSTIALLLRLPIYLDSAGTIFTGALLGPLFGALTGILTSLLTGLTTDIFSLYYSPVQLCTGILAGFEAALVSRLARTRPEFLINACRKAGHLEAC